MEIDNQPILDIYYRKYGFGESGTLARMGGDPDTILASCDSDKQEPYKSLVAFFGNPPISDEIRADAIHQRIRREIEIIYFTKLDRPTAKGVYTALDTTPGAVLTVFNDMTYDLHDFAKTWEEVHRSEIRLKY